MLSLSHKTDSKIAKKLEAEGIAVVTLGKKDEPRVWGFEEYLDRKKISRETIQKSKPWKKREKQKYGGYGSRPLGITSKLSRTDIYEND